LFPWEDDWEIKIQLSRLCDVLLGPVGEAVR